MLAYYVIHVLLYKNVYLALALYNLPAVRNEHTKFCFYFLCV